MKKNSNFIVVVKTLLISSLSFVTASAAAEEFQPQYGVIPFESTLCSSIGMAASVEIASINSQSIGGEVGGGIALALLAKIGSEFEAAAGITVGMNSEAAVSTKTCMTLFNNFDDGNEYKSDDEFERELTADMSSVDAYLLKDIRGGALGQDFDSDNFAMDIIKHATNLRMSVGTSQAVLANYGVMTKSITDVLTNDDPLNIQKMIGSLKRVAENSGEFIHPRIKRTLLHLDLALERHIKNLDVMGRSCQDLDSGNITHLPEDLIGRLRGICSEFNQITETTSIFVNIINDSVEQTAKSGKQLANVVKDSKEMQSALNTVSNGIGDIKESVSTATSNVSQLANTTKIATEGLNNAVASTEQIVTGSLKQVTRTVAIVSSSASDASSFATTGLNDLKNTVTNVVNKIDSVSTGSVTALPKMVENFATAAATAAANAATAAANAAAAQVAAVSSAVKVMKDTACNASKEVDLLVGSKRIYLPDWVKTIIGC